MEVINLDKFRAQRLVSIKGVTYEVYGIPVGQFIGNNPIQKVDDLAGNPVEQFAEIVSVLRDYSNIPLDVLNGMSIRQLMVLIMIIQGVDPDKLESKEAAEEGKPGKP